MKKAEYVRVLDNYNTANSGVVDNWLYGVVCGVHSLAMIDTDLTAKDKAEITDIYNKYSNEFTKQ